MKASTRVEGAAWLARVQHEAEARVAQQVQSGDLVPRSVLHRQLQWPDPAIDAALAEGRLFAVRDAQGTEFFPAFYVDQRLDRGAIEAIAQCLASVSVDWRHLFFTTPWPSLQDRSALEAIAQGDVAAVHETATRFLRGRATILNLH